MMSIMGKICHDVVTQALEWYGLPDNNGSAIQLLCMIAAHESGDFHYIKQVKGPALSIFQMEPNTYNDVMEYIKRRQEQFPILVHDMPKPAEYMAFDPVYAAAIGRVFLLRVPKPLPLTNDIEGLAKYAKDHWNTHLGAAKWEDYLEAWLRHYSSATY